MRHSKVASQSLLLLCNLPAHDLQQRSDCFVKLVNFTFEHLLEFFSYFQYEFGIFTRDTLELQKTSCQLLMDASCCSEFLALKHESRIHGHSFNIVCGLSMMQQVRLCAVWSMENWFASSLNQIHGWTTVQ